jgi:hypothetical protein
MKIFALLSSEKHGNCKKKKTDIERETLLAESKHDIKSRSRKINKSIILLSKKHEKDR